MRKSRGPLLAGGPDSQADRPPHPARDTDQHRNPQDREHEHAGSLWEDGGWMLAQPNGRPHVTAALRNDIASRLDGFLWGPNETETETGR